MLERPRAARNTSLLTEGDKRHRDFERSCSPEAITQEFALPTELFTMPSIQQAVACLALPL
jgi:hypothetical protein